MTDEELIELLNTHADSLTQEADLTEELLTAAPEAERGPLKPLLALARRVKAILLPVEPRRDFVAELKGELRAQLREAAAQQEERKRKAIWIAAGLGGLVYFIGLAVVSVRLSLAMLSFIAGLLGWRLTRRPLPKTRAAN